nr:dienelactone hydrolase family protein [uncultured Roseococcus sp.]
MIRALMALLLLTACAGSFAADEAAMTPAAPAQLITVPGAEGASLRALLFVPANPTREPVIALHSCSGLGTADRPLRLPPHQQDWTARLVAAGHPVLFPDSFGSRGLGQACGVPAFPAGPVSVRRWDALEAARWARAQPWARGEGVVLIGWSHGGSTTLAAWNAAPPGLVHAAIAMYPGCGRAQGVSIGPIAGTAPLLMLLGAADDWTPPQPCEQMAASAPGRIEVELYRGAHHSFDQLSGGIRTMFLPNNRTVSLGPNPEARAAARLRVAAFLEAHAGPP